MQHKWGEKRDVYRLLVEKPEGKMPRMWVDIIRMDLIRVGWGDVDGLVWLRIGTGEVLL
jgi:hypothetical protein